MQTAPSKIVEFEKANYKSLPSRVAANAAGMMHVRADYELFWLRKSRKEVTKLARLTRKCRTFAGIAALSRELREWCEKERVLLRIPLPREQPVKLVQQGTGMLDVAPVRQAEQPSQPEQPAPIALPEEHGPS